MTWYVNLILSSTDTFSEHYCQPRAYLPLLILMATFRMTVFWNIEHICDYVVMVVWKLGLYLPIQ
jgi:hypothetical protein